MTDYKEAYHALRSQHSELQRQYHERTEELKRTNVFGLGAAGALGPRRLEHLRRRRLPAGTGATGHDVGQPKKSG
jgi:cytochrome c-type biogenesis protein CcmH/NrfG